ncbi:MAG: ribonuclease J [Pseudomonadota bacterium]
MKNSDFVFLPLGGSGEIGMNMNLYGVGRPNARKWLMVDCGISFAGLDTPGIDVIMPDPGYARELGDNLLGLLITHGHEDHIGSVAHIAPMLDVPVYATPFTAELIRSKIEEKDVDVDLRVIETGARFEIGPFDLEYIMLTHSIPEPHAIVFRTQNSTTLHTGDWKLDETPSLGPPPDIPALKRIGEEGIDCIVCDSTNVFSPGKSGSEDSVEKNLTKIIGDLPNRVFVATFASNLGRVVSVCRAAAAADRSVCLLGRSMLRIVAAARAVDLLPEGLRFVDPQDAGYLPKDKILYLCTGSQGEPRAALSRIARDDHPEIAISEGDTVMFSSKIIPGNEREIYDLQNGLVDLGATIITEKDAPIHVSGHPNQGELELMYQWVKPRMAIPVHGEARHLEFHAEFARNQGVETTLAPRNGDMIRIDSAGLEVIDEVPVGTLLLDGRILVPDGAGSVRERRKLGWAGICAISVAIDGKGNVAGDIEVRCVGAPLIDGEPLDEFIADAVAEALEVLPPSRRKDEASVDAACIRAARQTAMEVWGKKPVVTVATIWV